MNEKQKNNNKTKIENLMKLRKFEKTTSLPQKNLLSNLRIACLNSEPDFNKILQI